MFFQRIHGLAASYLRHNSHGRVCLRWASNFAIAHSTWFKVEGQGMVRHRSAHMIGVSS